ncbi:MAG: hypothetical protein OXG46_08285 [Chloroflexi bacterium]|nr:hypothetical protein [Chloroflexota bacterium]MCY3937424.1 hypothetical protein [Chloroflexota bacterium]
MPQSQNSNSLHELTEALRELMQLIERAAGPGAEDRKSRFRELIERIDALGAALPPTERSLRHYVKQHSYAKALAYLEGT